ncbi:hypothetical protein MWU52_07565 [Jannaschia sp. S6380]|uniref:hypothetical protein n=1 Tax=Jannaschia sp. S6380 TaxID=2926408 RepID=UPI001FF2DD13|nr:hypothetical protein [Jannaschia sp. S6380]MCK0167401.1 hypothetical protein [Jannaschia sp. S6380]
MPERLATCCYCGRRSALRVRDHALACGSCGAPLTRMKPLAPDKARMAASHAARPQSRPTPVDRKRRGKKKKKSKGFWHEIVEEIWDEIEDIFD